MSQQDTRRQLRGNPGIVSFRQFRDNEAWIQLGQESPLMNKKGLKRTIRWSHAYQLQMLLVITKNHNFWYLISTVHNLPHQWRQVAETPLRESKVLEEKKNSVAITKAEKSQYYNKKKIPFFCRCSYLLKLFKIVTQIGTFSCFLQPKCRAGSFKSSRIFPPDRPKISALRFQPWNSYRGFSVTVSGIVWNILITALTTAALTTILNTGLYQVSVYTPL